MSWRTTRSMQSPLILIILASFASLLFLAGPPKTKGQMPPLQRLPQGSPISNPPAPPSQDQQLPTSTPPLPPISGSVPPGASLPPGPSPPGTPCPTDPPAPVVSLQMRVVACSVEGEDIHNHLSINNNKKATAYSVTVKDALPNNATYVTATPKPTLIGPELVWQFGTLQGCCSKSIRLVLRPTGSGPVQNCARVSFEHGQCVTTQVAKRFAPSAAVPGVTPGGGGLGPGLPGGQQPGREPETPGQPKQKDGKKNGGSTIPPPPSGKGDGTIPRPDNPRITPEILPVGKFGLDITGKAVAIPGQPLVYTITLKNLGKSAIKTPQVKVPIPRGIEYVSSNPEGVYLFPQAPTKEIIWNLPSMEVNETRQLQFTVKALPRQDVERWTICFEPEATGSYLKGDDAVKASAKFCTKFFSKAGLDLSAEISLRGALFIGDTTEFIIVASNPGSAEVKNLQVTVTSFPGIQIYDAKGPTNDKRNAFPASNKFVVEFAPLPRLPAGETRTYTVSLRGVQIKNDPQADRKTKIRVEFITDKIKTPLISEESVRVTTESPDQPPNGGFPPSRSVRLQTTLRKHRSLDHSRIVRLEGVERVVEGTPNLDDGLPEQNRPARIVKPLMPLMPKMPPTIGPAKPSNNATDSGARLIPRH
ncbi:MAG: hypothetical protein ACFCD0_22095 [Gemmataceae bacterium]